MSYLSSNFLLYRESQQRTRWLTKFAAFASDVAKLEPGTPGQLAMINNIKAGQMRLKAVFDNVASSGAAPITDPAAEMAYIQVSWSRMEVQNQGMVVDAHRLSQDFRNEVNQLRQTTDGLNLALIAVFGAYFVANYSLVHRRILDSLAELEKGTRVIGSGTLDHVIPGERKDEVGALTRAFNQMTANLKSVTASKADLECEITERKRVEDSLRVSEARYRSLFESMNEGFALHEIICDDRGKPVDYRFLEINPAFERLTGLKRETILGRTVRDALPGIEDYWIQTYGKVALTASRRTLKTTPHPFSSTLKSMRIALRRVSSPLCSSTSPSANARKICSGTTPAWWIASPRRLSLPMSILTYRVGTRRP